LQPINLPTIDPTCQQANPLINRPKNLHIKLTFHPSKYPTLQPTKQPTFQPTVRPTFQPIILKFIKTQILKFIKTEIISEKFNSYN
jgi:hypothetical protein